MKAQMRFSEYELNRIIVSILTYVSNTRFIKNVDELFNMFEESSYNYDENKAVKVLLVKDLTRTIIENSIHTKDVLLNMISFFGKYSDNKVAVLNELYDQTISDQEATTLDGKISELLRLATVEAQLESITKRYNDIKSDSYDGTLKDELSALEDGLNSVTKTLKNYREAIDEANNTVALDDYGILNRLGKIIEKENNPSSTVRTPIKALNEILDGGWKCGRCYVALAPSKNWKSGFLLTCALAGKKYNNLKPKDPTKKPIVLYLTLENSVDESIVRTVAHFEGNNFLIKDHTPEEIATMLKAHGIYTPNDDSALGIEFMYAKNKSKTVSDIKTILEDYEKKGKEVVFLVIDYLKRIKADAQFTKKDIRGNIELGSIADDLHDLAIEKDIPVLTAMQLGRSAISEMDIAQTFDQKLAAFGRIGASNIAESIDIVQNVDFAFVMVKIVDAKFNDVTGEQESIDKYLDIKVVASRYRSSDIETFIHRFKDGNDMCLEEDADDSYSKSILNKQVLIQQRTNSTGVRTSGPRTVKR